MGCHTWYSVPVKTDKKEIIELAQKFLNEHKFLGDDHKKMYQFAIDNELCDVVTELASYDIDGTSLGVGEWVVYLDERRFVIDEYNKTVEPDEQIDYYEFDKINAIGLDWCGSEPRIGGYPDKIIRSYDEMIKFMEDGYHGTLDDKPHHYTFTFEEDRRERVMNNIKRFFETYPQGVITFG